MTVKVKLVSIFIALFLFLSILDVFGIQLLRIYGGFVRLVPVEDLNSVQATFSSENAKILAKDFHGENHLVLLQQVMEFVPKVEDFGSHRITEIYEHVQQGGGLICTGMATLYSGVLEINDIKTRHVVLKRNIFNIYDAHTTVEVFVGGKWIIYDPTFNTSFMKDGELIGAQEIADSLYDGSFYQVKPVFHGDVLYPARLDNYYMHWLPLFNNVFVWERSSNPILGKLPPFRYWFGPVYYFEAKEEHRYFHHEFQEDLYFTFVVVFPITIFTSVGCIVVLLFHILREK